jgi:hypothetical protein
MDRQSFDGLAKSLARSRTRRWAARALLVSAAGAASTLFGTRASLAQGQPREAYCRAQCARSCAATRQGQGTRLCQEVCLPRCLD